MNFRLNGKTFNFFRKMNWIDYRNPLAALKASQYLKSDKLRELQWQRLKKLILFAYKEVPYYHNLFKKIGLKPEDINNYEYFSKIPVLTKQMVRDNFKDLHCLNYSAKKYFRSITSGSTGKPLTIDIEKDALNYYYASQYRWFSWHGIFPGDSGVKIWGIPIGLFERVVERLKDLAMNRIRFSAFKLSEKQVDDYYSKIKKFKPKYIYGYTSALFHFASSIEKKSLGMTKYRPKAVFSTSEILYPHQKELISSVFNCPVVNEYGCSEFGIVAFKCLKHNLHITSENIYTEIINADLEGIGQLIVTGLRNYVMPLENCA
ncbi:MAG: hypothetical protein KKD35_02115 [Elusimicrobia bacterium]|nr:hypothetical protein [Elusimicrobiota bacterium]